MLLLLPFPTASKCENTKNIPCPTFADIASAIRALTSLNVSKNAMLTKEAGKALAGALANNSVLRELHVSRQGGWRWDDGPGFAQELAIGLTTNGALTDLNISNNHLGERVLPKGWTETGYNFDNSKMYKHTDGREQKEAREPAGVIAICDAIPAMRVLTTLNISKNKMATKEAGKALADALASNSVLKELDVSSNYERYYGLDGAGFAQELAAGLSTNANGALTSLNIMGNKIGKEQLSKLLEIMKAHPMLVSLCGIADDATEANLSGLRMDVDDAVVLADELPAKGALTRLNISKQAYKNEYGEAVGGIGAEGAKAIAEALKSNVRGLDLWFNCLGAFTSLDISNNDIEGEALLQRISELCNKRVSS